MRVCTEQLPRMKGGARWWDETVPFCTFASMNERTPVKKASNISFYCRNRNPTNTAEGINIINYFKYTFVPVCTECSPICLWHTK